MTTPNSFLVIGGRRKSYLVQGLNDTVQSQTPVQIDCKWCFGQGTQSKQTLTNLHGSLAFVWVDHDCPRCKGEGKVWIRRP